HRLGRPVLVDGAHLELLQVAPVRMRTARLACRLISVDLGHATGECQVAHGGCAALGPPTQLTCRSMRNPRDFAKSLAIGAPVSVLEIPFKPSQMIHFLDFS